MSLPDPAVLITTIADELKTHLQAHNIDNPRFVGIHTGGVWVANALLKELKSEEPLGILNVSFYRDDFSRSGLHPQVRPSQLPFDISDQHLVLIDDVLMSGRTIRAALNELFDYGRPDIVGATLSLDAMQRVKLIGPEPLAIQLKTLDHL